MSQPSENSENQWDDGANEEELEEYPDQVGGQFLGTDILFVRYGDDDQLPEEVLAAIAAAQQDDENQLILVTLENLDEVRFEHEWQERSAREHLRPWAERRGIESIDRNARTILIKAPLDEVSEILVESAIATQQNIIGTEITIPESFAFAYQIEGQNWTVVTDAMTHPNPLEHPQLAQLSQRIGQPIIELEVSDGCGCISYKLFEDGSLVEYFVGDEGGNFDAPPDERMQQFKVTIPEEPEDDSWKAYFWSSRRQITEVSSIWSFTARVLSEYEAYDPAIDVGNFLEGYYARRGQRYTIQQPESILVVDSHLQVKAVPPFMRVDYFRFNSLLEED